MHKTIEELQSELRAQDEALAAAKEQLASFGDVELAVPRTLTDELEELAAPRIAQPLTCALRA